LSLALLPLGLFFYGEHIKTPGYGLSDLRICSALQTGSARQTNGCITYLDRRVLIRGAVDFL
jgi:hypothetical protein